MAFRPGVKLSNEVPAEKVGRRELAQACRELGRRGLNTGRSGNASCLLQHGRILITPTGAVCDSMTEDSFVVFEPDGHIQGTGTPSCEWQMHLGIYREKPEAGSIIHTHADACVVLSCLRRPIPAFHYRVAAFGGHDIPCADYATFGTHDLAHSAISALRLRRACLLANHGMVCYGETVAGTLTAAIELEALARQYLMALQAGEPAVLNEAEMSLVREQLRTYSENLVRRT
jgi:L-fuculose-phosphate aldolase